MQRRGVVVGQSEINIAIGAKPSEVDFLKLAEQTHTAPGLV